MLEDRPFLALDGLAMMRALVMKVNRFNYTLGAGSTMLVSKGKFELDVQPVEDDEDALCSRYLCKS